jgi:hypothetical protein
MPTINRFLKVDQNIYIHQPTMDLIVGILKGVFF